MSESKYVSCEVAGSGKLNKDVSFKIIELSAEKIRIKTDAPLEIGNSVNLDILLDSIIFQIEINAKGNVSEKINDGYEIIFEDLSDEARTEIDELMKSTCNMI